MIDKATFQNFEEVIAFAKAFGFVRYQAPMDRYSVKLHAEVRGNRLRLFPNPNLADPFWADSSHLDRFRK